MPEFEKRPASPPSNQPQYDRLRAQYLSQRKAQDVTNIAGCVSTGSGSNATVKRRRKKDLGVWGTLRTSVVHHQIGISINLLLLLCFAHFCLPAAKPITAKFFALQYPAGNNLFARGPDDVYYVLTWIVIFTGLREAVMTYILHPFAALCGVRKASKKTRFVEQAWLFVYYTIFWTLGMYIYCTSEYFLNLPKLWEDFPVRHMDTLFKHYYLIQFAFWLQQIVVVNIEERRKDHWQMFTHHIVTCLLLTTSYGYYQTRVGNLILCVMDIVDVTLPAAKMLKYAGFERACDFAFGVFMISWVLARHIAYLAICWSVHFDTRAVMTFGCYDSITGERTSTTPPPDSRFVLEAGPDGSIPPGGTEIWTNIVQPYAYPGETVCYNNNMSHLFLALLLFLQGITILWFTMILRVAWRVVKGQGADEVRSDDEDDGANTGEELDIEDIEPAKPLRPVEQVVGVEGLNIKRKSSPMSSRFSGVRKEQGSSTSIGVKKEILNRIGCDKPME